MKALIHNQSDPPIVLSLIHDVIDSRTCEFYRKESEAEWDADYERITVNDVIYILELSDINFNQYTEVVDTIAELTEALYNATKVGRVRFEAESGELVIV